MHRIFGLFLLAIAFFAPDLAHAANRFAVCTTTCTWDSTSTAMWCATDTGCTGATAPGSGDAVIFNANTCVGGTTCTITVDSTIDGASFQSITAGACTASTNGCILDFSVNNPSITLTSTGMNLSGTGTRKYLLGSGTFTFTGTSSVFDIGTTTNLDATSVTTAALTYTGNQTASRNFNGGGRTLGAVTFATNTSGGSIRIFSANTFGSLSIAAGTPVLFPTGTTTISNPVTWTGTSTNPIIIENSDPQGGITLSFSSGASTMDWGVLLGVTTTGSGTFVGSNCLDIRTTFDSGDSCAAPSGGGGGGGRIIGG